MAKNINKQHIKPLLQSITSVYTAASFGATAVSLTAQQLKTLIDSIHGGFNSATAAWVDLLAEAGNQGTARNIVADALIPAPGNITNALGDIETAVDALLTDYEVSAFGVGDTAWTYSFTLTSGVFSGGHTDINIPAPLLATINSRCATLRDEAVVLADVS